MKTIQSSAANSTCALSACIGLLLLSASPLHAVILNGSFEDPRFTPGTADFAFVDHDMIPGWRTTAPDRMIEIWSDGGYQSRPLSRGPQFAELNANGPSTLYQDTPAELPGIPLSFRFAHLGRQGTDTVRLTITDFGANNVPGGGDDAILFTRDYSTNQTAWVTYTEPVGSTIMSLGHRMRFALEPLAWAGGDPSIGNLIDDVAFGASATPFDNPATLLARGGDGNGLTWADSPATASPWHAQTATTHDGIDALQSGILADGSFSGFQITLTGPGTLSYWWRVSSQAGSDVLSLIIDGTPQPGAISGEAGWAQVSRSISAGPHVVSWLYTKDAAVAAGLDAGWVDEINFTPTDTDADGLPDWWEALHFGNISAGAAGDADRDGQTNLEEWRAGTEPVNPASVQQYDAVTLVPGGTQLTWSALPGRVFSAHYSTNLLAWSPLPGLLASAGPGTRAMVSVPGAAQPVTFIGENSTFRVHVPASDIGTLWRGGQELAFAAGGGDGTWMSGTRAVGYENDFVPSPNNVPYTTYIGTDVKTQMFNLRSSAYVRIPFQVADVAQVSAMLLHLRVDDGCVVYLNGTPVATHRTPYTLAWNSLATAQTPDSEAVLYKQVDLTPWRACLVQGANILAIHAMNQALGSSDFLIHARLEGTLETPAPEPSRIFWQLLPR